MKTKSIKSVLAALGWITLTMSLSSFLEKIAAEKFTVDPAASSLVWTGKKVTGEHTGTIKISSGEIVLEDKVISSGNFDIDLSSITVTDVQDKESNQKLVNHLKGDDFFSVAKYPKSTFTILSVSKSNNSKDYTVKGKLTIKGITNEIEFPATISREGKKVVAAAKIIVDRTKYGIKFRSTNFFENLGDKAIYNDFELSLKLVAIQNSGI